MWCGTSVPRTSTDAHGTSNKSLHTAVLIRSVVNAVFRTLTTDLRFVITASRDLTFWAGVPLIRATTP